MVPYDIVQSFSCTNSQQNSQLITSTQTNHVSRSGQFDGWPRTPRPLLGPLQRRVYSTVRRPRSGTQVTARLHLSLTSLHDESWSVDGETKQDDHPRWWSTSRLVVTDSMYSSYLTSLEHVGHTCLWRQRPGFNSTGGRSSQRAHCTKYSYFTFVFTTVVFYIWLAMEHAWWLLLYCLAIFRPHFIHARFYFIWRVSVYE